MLKVQYKKSATKALLRMPKYSARKFILAFEQLAQGNNRQLDIKQLENREGFRMRIGTYRAIYRILEDVLIIEVLKIGSRGDVYK